MQRQVVDLGVVRQQRLVDLVQALGRVRIGLDLRRQRVELRVRVASVVVVAVTLAVVSRQHRL